MQILAFELAAAAAQFLLLLTKTLLPLLNLLKDAATLLCFALLLLLLKKALFPPATLLLLLLTLLLETLLLQSTLLFRSLSSNSGRADFRFMGASVVATKDVDLRGEIFSVSERSGRDVSGMRRSDPSNKENKRSRCCKCQRS